MMVRAFAMAMLLVGCTAPKDDASADGNDTAVSSDGGSDTEGSELPDGLHGELVDPRLPVPDFVATNRDGTSRGPADLTDGPTVMWFYPAAGTYG